MFIFRAVNVYPGQVDHVLSRIAGIGSEYQIHLDRRADGKDYMLVKVERGIDCVFVQGRRTAKVCPRGD